MVNSRHASWRATTSRLEAFSDGVIAIIVTIMVRIARAAQPTLPALLKVAPVFTSYGRSLRLLPSCG